MERRTIITISREYGSGGREIGKILAKQLGIPFYDKELITRAAEKSGYAAELFEKADQTATNSLLYSLSLIGTATTLNGLPLNDKLFMIQANVIKDVAKEGSCVIVGRCADYVLRNDPDCFHVFIYADLDFKLERGVKVYGIDPEEVKDTLLKTDKRRATYYNYYTNQKWGRAENYHLSLNSGCIGTENAAKVIQLYVESRI